MVLLCKFQNYLLFTEVIIWESQTKRVKSLYRLEKEYDYDSKSLTKDAQH